MEALKKFGLSKEEFRLHVWPELPASKLEKNPLPFDYGWNDLHQKSTSSLRRTYAAYGGRKLTFISVYFEDETTAYDTFKVHRDARVVVRDEENGDTQRFESLRLDFGKGRSLQALQLRHRLSPIFRQSSCPCFPF